MAAQAVQVEAAAAAALEVAAGAQAGSAQFHTLVIPIQAHLEGRFSVEASLR